MSYSSGSSSSLPAAPGHVESVPDTAPAGPGPPEAYSPRAGSEELEYISPPDNYFPPIASPDAPTFPEPIPEPQPYIPSTPEVRRRSSHASSRSSLSPDLPPKPPPEADMRQSMVRSSVASLDATGRTASGHRRRHTHASTYNLEDIVQAFAGSHHDSKNMRRSLKAAMQKLEQAKQRADHAEHIAAQLVGRVNKVAGQKSTAARDASAAREELNLYKVQYSNAQRELERGNRALQDSEARRDEAETAAARARDRARDMRTQLLVERALEEGRRAGLQEGLRLYRGRHYIHEYDDYGDDNQDVDEAMNDILTQNGAARSEYTSRSQPEAAPPTRRSTRSTQRTPQPPQQNQYVFSDRTDSEPLLMQGDGPTPESFYADTPTPAPREYAPERMDSETSSATTSTLPLGPPPPAIIVPPRMSTIHEVPSRGSMVSTVPTITREEPRSSSRTSRRSGIRSQPPPPRERTPSPAPTIPLEPHEIPQSPNTAFAPPPGAIDYATVAAQGQARSLSPVSFGVPPLGSHPPPFRPRANPTPNPQPFIPSAPPSPRGSMRGIGSPGMMTGELQQSWRESQAGPQSGSSRPAYPRVQPPRPVPPRFTPSPTVPAPLAPQPQRQPQPFSQPRPSSASGSIPQPYIPAPSETMSSRHGHRRSHSANIPPPNHEVQRPQPAPFRPRHGPESMVRRSTSGGGPIQISVESPSDPGNTPTPASQPVDNNSREYLSPRQMPSTLPPRPSSSSSSPVVPSPTSTPRSVSNPPPQPARAAPTVPVAAPLYGQPPDPSSYYGRQPPPVVPSTGSARRGPLRQPAPPVVPSSSGSSSRPQRYPPRVHESQSPEDTRPPASATSRMYGALTRSTSMGAAPPSNTVPIIVPPPGSGRSPRLANGPLPGQPAIYQAEEAAQARPAAYRGQPPVPIPPRHGSPAPLMVPSPETRGAPLYVPSPEHRVAALGSSYAGATPRIGMNGLPSEQGYGNGYIPRSPTGSVSNLAPPSPRGPHANPLFTRFDRNSMENMGDMSQVALATAAQPPEESATNVLTRGLRNVFGGRGRRK